jgi:long-chain acyl-CoA synthetase
MNTISVQQAFSGKHILVTGASGFLGKVWLTMLLDRVPSVGRVYVLLRKKGLRPARDRFEKMVGSTHVFQPLHEEHGADLGRFLAERVEVLDGDISKENFGIDEVTLARLRRDVDLLVQVAGLVDFNPDVRDSLNSNVHGAVNAAQLVESCDHAKLLHVSTCYVVGNVDGLIEETLEDGVAPNGSAFSVADELTYLNSQIDAIEAAVDTPEVEAEIRDVVHTRIRDRGLDAENDTLVRNMTHRERGQTLKKKMVALGMDRANEWGWPNTYTYTKSLAERVLAARNGKLTWASFRPAIVESAMSYPFPGWNEGFNTCGPLVYLLEKWFRMLPAKGENAFDVIPVDLVCNAMFIAAAELLLDCHQAVYHCGTSHRNRLSIQRATDLTSLGLRRHLRKNGETPLERVLLSRWDAVPSSAEHWLSPKNLGKAAKGLGQLLRDLPGGVPAVIRKNADSWAVGADNAAKQMKQVSDVHDLFRPFTHDNSFIFECESLRRSNVEEDEFQFEPESIDWLNYWIEIHMPGMRRWCFPIIEGKQPESYKPEIPFEMQAPRKVSEPQPARRAVAQGEGL